MTNQEEQAASHIDIETLNAYVDGTLAPEERASVDAHVARCASCRNELDGLRATVSLLQGLPQFSPPVSFQLGGEYARSFTAPSKVVRFLPLVRTLSVAAVLLFMVVTGVTLFDREGGSNDGNSAMQSESAPGAADSREVSGTGTDEQTSVSAEDSSSGSERQSLIPEPTAAEGVIDRGEAASAGDAPAAPAMADSADSIDQAAAESVATPDPSEDVVHPSESVDNSENDGRSPWIVASVALGFLAIVLIGLWILLSRSGRKRRID